MLTGSSSWHAGADHHGLVEQRMGYRHDGGHLQPSPQRQLRLDLDRRHVGAARLDHGGQPAAPVEDAVLVEVTGVAGAEVAVPVEVLLG